MSLHDDENVVEKEVSSPSSDVHDNFVKDINDVPKDPKHTFLALPLPFPQRMSKAKLD